MLDPVEEFLKAMTEYQPPADPIVEYRAYFDKDGWVQYFAADSGIGHEFSWITINKELYQTMNWQWLRVVDNKIVEQRPNNNYYFSLTRSDKGVKVVKAHAGIVVESRDDWNEVEYYDRRNN